MPLSDYERRMLADIELNWHLDERRSRVLAAGRWAALLIPWAGVYTVLALAAVLEMPSAGAAGVTGIVGVAAGATMALTLVRLLTGRPWTYRFPSSRWRKRR